MALRWASARARRLIVIRTVHGISREARPRDRDSHRTHITHGHMGHGLATSSTLQATYSLTSHRQRLTVTLLCTVTSRQTSSKRTQSTQRSCVAHAARWERRSRAQGAKSCDSLPSDPIPSTDCISESFAPSFSTVAQPPKLLLHAPKRGPIHSGALRAFACPCRSEPSAYSFSRCDRALSS
jgi:hypothetical protein